MCSNHNQGELGKHTRRAGVNIGALVGAQIARHGGWRAGGTYYDYWRCSQSRPSSAPPLDWRHLDGAIGTCRRGWWWAACDLPGALARSLNTAEELGELVVLTLNSSRGSFAKLDG